MTEIKKKRGRPKEEKALRNRLILRLSDQEKAELETKASRKSLTLSAWARLTLHQAP